MPESLQQKQQFVLLMSASLLSTTDIFSFVENDPGINYRLSLMIEFIMIILLLFIRLLPQIPLDSGVSRISFWGGGGKGASSPRNFLKMVQFGAFGEYFAKVL